MGALSLACFMAAKLWHFLSPIEFCGPPLIANKQTTKRREKRKRKKDRKNKRKDGWRFICPACSAALPVYTNYCFDYKNRLPVAHWLEHGIVGSFPWDCT